MENSIENFGTYNDVENTPKKKSRFIKSVQLIIFLGLGIFFIWISIRGLTPEHWESIKKSVTNVNTPRGWTWLVLSVIVGGVSHYVRAIRNILLIEPLNYKVRKSMAFYSVMICYFANIAFPRLGEVLRCSFLQRYEKVPFQKALGTVVTERTLDMAVWVILFVIAILFNTSAISVIQVSDDITIKTWLYNTTTGLLATFKLYAAVVVLILLTVTLYLTRKKWTKISIFVKIKQFFIGIWQGLISIKDVQKPYLFTFYTVLMWVLYFLGTYCVFIAFGFFDSLPYHSTLPAFSVLVFSTIAYMVAPEGLGAYPLMVAGTLLLYDIDYGVGLAAGWIGWTSQFILIIFLGTTSLILASLTSKKEKIHETKYV